MSRKIMLKPGSELEQENQLLSMVSNSVFFVSVVVFTLVDRKSSPDNRSHSSFIFHFFLIFSFAVCFVFSDTFKHRPRGMCLVTYPCSFLTLHPVKVMLDKQTYDAMSVAH